MIRCWNALILVLIELPDIGQGSEGDVESAVRPHADVVSDPQRLECLSAHGYRVVPGGGIQPKDVAALLPDTHEAIEAIEFGEHVVKQLLDARLV